MSPGHDVGPPLPDAGAWPRLFARLFDLWWQIPLVGFVLTVVLSLLSDRFADWVATAGGAERFAFFCVPFAFVLDAVLVARCGASPGKLLLGLRVVTLDGGRPRLKAALRRGFGVWFAGLALTIVPLNLLTMARQGWRLRKGRPASYDAGRFRVEARPLSLRRAVGFTLAVIALVIVLGLLARPAVEQALDAVPGAATTWTNPETGAAITVPPTWQYQMREGDDGKPVHQFDLVDGSAAVVFTVQESGVATLADIQRDTSEMLHDVEMGSGRFEPFLSHPSWAAEGFSNDDDATRYKVRVMQRDGRYWQAIVVQDRPYPDTDAVAEALQEALWSTVVDG